MMMNADSFIVVDDALVHVSMFSNSVGLQLAMSQSVVPRRGIPLCPMMFRNQCAAGSGCFKVHLEEPRRVLPCDCCDAAYCVDLDDAACGGGHRLCRSCVTSLVDHTLAVDTSHSAQVPCPVMNCSSCVPTNRLLSADPAVVQKVLDALRTAVLAETFTAAEQCIADVRREAAQCAPDECVDAVWAERAADYELRASQMQSALDDALMCPQCRTGPVVHFRCLDLMAHNGEQRGAAVVDNSCHCCGFFSNSVNSWAKWDGELVYLPGNTIGEMGRRKECLRVVIGTNGLDKLLCRLEAALETLDESCEGSVSMRMKDHVVRYAATLRDSLQLFKENVTVKTCAAMERIVADFTRALSRLMRVPPSARFPSHDGVFSLLEPLHTIRVESGTNIHDPYFDILRFVGHWTYADRVQDEPEPQHQHVSARRRTRQGQKALLTPANRRNFPPPRQQYARR